MKYRGTKVGTVSDLLNLWNCRAQFDNAWKIIETQQLSVSKGKPLWKLQNIRKDILHLPVLKSRRLVKTAGKACYGDRCILLHEALFDKHDPVYKDRYDTFFHEIAHFMALWIYHKTGHEDEWKFCFSTLGFIPHQFYAAHIDYRGYKERQMAPLNGVADMFADLEL